MIFIIMNDYFRAEPVIISRPSNNTTAEPIDSLRMACPPALAGSQTPSLPAGNSQRAIQRRLEAGGQLMRLRRSRRGEYGDTCCRKWKSISILVHEPCAESFFLCVCIPLAVFPSSIKP